MVDLTSFVAEYGSALVALGAVLLILAMARLAWYLYTGYRVFARRHWL